MKHHRPIFGIIIITFVICLITIVTISIYWKGLVLDLAEDQFRAVFNGSFVTIGSRNVTPSTIIFRDIDIKTRGQQFLKIKEFRITFTILSILRDRTARFFIEKAVVYDKLKILEVRGVARHMKGILLLDSLSIWTLGGIIEGKAMAKPGKAPSYSAFFTLKDIQLEKIVEAFELNEKIYITGFVSGSIKLSGEGSLLTSLEGQLKAYPEGGMITIKNKEWLDAIALYAKQDINVIVESFKNYRYNAGNADLELREGVIIINAHLNGEAGKRDLLVSLHDFN